MKQPLVSVLMPNHNGGRFIAETIRSVLSQSFQDFEFIIVEDASTDDSRKVIASFKDERIRLIELNKNEHICVALNIGIGQVRGKYIARIDSDDCWLPEKLEKQIAYMEANPQCGASFTWVNVIDEEGRQLTAEESGFVDLFHVENKTREEWIRHFFHNGSCLCHPSAVMRTDVARAMGGYRNVLVQIQDFDMWMRIAKQHDIHILTEPLMNYRHCLQGGNVSAVNYTTQRRTYYEMYRIMGKFFDDLSDEEFVRYFGCELKNPNASMHEELLCERALFLLDPIFCGHATKLSGMEKLADLIDNDETRALLSSQYGITQMNFYQLSASESLHMIFESDDAILARYSNKKLIKHALKRKFSKHPRLFKVMRSVYRFLRSVLNKVRGLLGKMRRLPGKVRSKMSGAIRKVKSVFKRSGR